ncbi:hypothetical protein [Paracoccus sp. (in: a-proteobacteria)]|uniref:hypothetical protein n=1 Tax=Paracoccus sp. TaxID=267 RepID=UPI00289FC61E|nr:hypothetical protein [Paracoccus sp. (in: a-proteobacteria)]
MNPPFRRRVLYLPGYDPIPPRRYRELYHREGRDQAAISQYSLSFGPRRDRTGFGWGVRGDFSGRRTESEFEVLLWADLVQRSMGQSVFATYGQLLRTAWIYIGSGALFSLMRLRRGPVLAALYPVVILLLQLLAAITVAGVGAATVGTIAGRLMPYGYWLGLPVFLGVTWAALAFWRRIDGKLFAYYLMHDYAFTADLRGSYPDGLNQRISWFATRINQVLDEDWDEVLIVGHSSGAYLAVSVLAEVLRNRPEDRDGPKLALLTLGQVVPMAAFLPRADRLRRDLHEVSASKALCWVDVSAPGDACSFGLCDPVAVVGVEPKDRQGPLVLSAAFRQSLSPQKQRALRGHWFRLHFQYLCAFDRPRDYDYFAITAGPDSLEDRFAGRSHSPGRIARPVNRYNSMAPE